MVHSARPCFRVFRRMAAPLALLVAAPVAAGETMIFEDSFDLAECSMWSASSNPLAAPDVDEDGYGDASMPTVYCQLPAGYVNDLSDCDDGADTIHPGALEVCDGVDNDCDDQTLDGDGDPSLGDSCDGSDSDLCADGFLVCASPNLYCYDATEENVEVCDGQDNDCDGEIDEGCPPPLSCTIVLDASSCSNGALPQLNLGMLTPANCRAQCQPAMALAGMTSGCWILPLDGNCYCRSGTLSLGGFSSGGSCS